MTPIDTGRWKVSIVASSIATEMPNGAHLPPDKRAISVEIVLENISAESSNLYRDLIKLDNVLDASAPQYYLKRDRAILWDLQPKMPEAVRHLGSSRRTYFARCLAAAG